MPCRSNFKADILPVAYTGQQKTTNGQKQTTIVKNRWILGHPNGKTPKDTMMSAFPKKLTGPRIITRPATTTTTTTLSPNTVPHFWTNLSKHRMKTRANLRLCKKRWLRQTQQQTMSRRDLDSGPTVHERCAQITWLLPCLKGQFDGCRSR